DDRDRLAAALAGRYAIERELGRGGMATVYLARDLKHDRDVAIKVLHEDLAVALGGERFLAEIKTTARLQHPHILPLLDSGDAAGFLYYVMPLATGETLRARLLREKQLPLEDVLRIAREVGDALQAAHAQGVIHRDIKPENILLQGGHALVADFGIALAVQSAGGARMTQTGLSLGTPQYMSPEQAMGEKALDARTDVYALGAVTYEMLTGEPPFTGATVQAIVAKVLTEKPMAPSAVRDTVSAGAEQAVLKALAKLPADRFASAQAFVDALERPGGAALNVSATASAAREAAAAPRGLGGSLAMRGALAALALVAVVASVGWWRASRESASALPLEGVRLTMNLPPGVRLIESPRALAVSRDGRMLAAVAVGADRVPAIYLRLLNDATPLRLEGTEGASSTTFSPDGKWIAFTNSQQLKRVPVGGGAAVVLAEASGEESGLAWGPAGLIFVGLKGRIHAVPENGGELRPLEGSTAPTGVSERYPIATPDGKSVIYTRWAGTITGARIFRRSLGGDHADAALLDSNDAIGLAKGWLVMGGAGGLLRLAPISDDGSRITGPVRQVFDGVASIIQISQVAIAADGTLLYQPGTGLADLVSVGAKGDSVVLTNERRNYLEGHLSPDGRYVATGVSARSGQDVYMLDLTARSLARLTTDGKSNARPEWTPDGKRVIYRSFRGGKAELWSQPREGGTAELFYSSTKGDIWEGVISPDGQWLIYRTGTLETSDMWARRLTDDTVTHPFAPSANTDVEARFAPDGKHVAYTSNESGVFHVYVRRFPEGDERVQISADGGVMPVWARDGRTLFYVGVNGGTVIRARLSLANGVSVVSRDTVVRGGYYLPYRNGHPVYDVMPDGARRRRGDPGGAARPRGVTVVPRLRRSAPHGARPPLHPIIWHASRRCAELPPRKPDHVPSHATPHAQAARRRAGRVRPDPPGERPEGEPGPLPDGDVPQADQRPVLQPRHRRAVPAAGAAAGVHRDGGRRRGRRLGGRGSERGRARDADEVRELEHDGVLRLERRRVGVHGAAPVGRDDGARGALHRRLAHVLHPAGRRLALLRVAQGEAVAGDARPDDGAGPGGRRRAHPLDGGQDAARARALERDRRRHDRAGGDAPPGRLGERAPPLLRRPHQARERRADRRGARLDDHGAAGVRDAAQGRARWRRVGQHHDHHRAGAGEVAGVSRP
ncbi:MAG: protein kinase, partial [Gemmatimonadetes bacterium]|nr:protein kinase [Gemmatimonadota bacterium]